LPREHAAGDELPGERVAGEVVFRPPPVDGPYPFRVIVDYEAELVRQRACAFNSAYRARPPRPGGFTARSLRRFSP